MPLTFRFKVQLFQLIPKRVFERAVIMEVVDLLRVHKFMVRGGDEHDSPLPETDDGARQRFKAFEETLVVFSTGLRVLKLTGK